MKSTLYVIRQGIAGISALALLAACDGRGSTPFRSYQFTPEEMAREKAELDKAKGKKESDSNGGQQPTGGGETGVPPGGATLDQRAPETGLLRPPPSSPGAVQTAAEAPAAAGDTGRARSKGIHEEAVVEPPGGGPNSPQAGGAAPATPQGSGRADNRDRLESIEIEDRLEASRTVLVKDVDERIRINVKDAAAARIVKQVSIDISTKTEPLNMTIRATVLVDGKDRFLAVVDAPVKFATDGREYAHQVGLFPDRQMKDGRVDPGKNIRVFGYCPAPDCQHAHVILDFAVSAGPQRARAVFILQREKDSKSGVEEFKIISSNLKDSLKPFVETEPGPPIPVPGPPVSAPSVGNVAPPTSPTAPSSAPVPEATKSVTPAQQAQQGEKKVRNLSLYNAAWGRRAVRQKREAEARLAAPTTQTAEAAPKADIVKGSPAVTTEAQPAKKVPSLAVALKAIRLAREAREKREAQTGSASARQETRAADTESEAETP